MSSQVNWQLTACLLATLALKCQSTVVKGNTHSEVSTNMSKNFTEAMLSLWCAFHSSSLMCRCILIITQPTSADVRLLTDLDQQGLFSYFCSTRDGSEWQVHEIKSLSTESLHFIFTCGNWSVCLALIVFLYQRVNVLQSSEKLTCRQTDYMFLFSLSKSTKLFFHLSSG